ncbi:heterokaryon incompatibility protein-domain-containing protein [Xylaria scruposa]|nr:heterokaryon incompatibility protein-domain-containing protein [Xylaria scruposa]
MNDRSDIMDSLTTQERTTHSQIAFPSDSYLRWNSDSFSISIKEAVRDGLDPNILWTEDELVNPRVLGGCVRPLVEDKDKAWLHWNTPFHRAMWIKDFESATFLLQKGADINLYNEFGQTALHEAVWRGDRNSVAFLLQHGADVSKPSIARKVKWQGRDIYGQGNSLALHLAISNADTAMAELLLDCGTDLHFLSAGCWTFLDLAFLARNRRAIGLFSSRGIRFSSPTFDVTTVPPNYMTKARDLLVVASSNRVIPPSELHDVYCHILSRLKLPIDLVYDTATINKTIKLVFDALYSAAGIQRPAPVPGSCDRCMEFQFQLDYFWESKNVPGHDFDFQLYGDRNQVENSASGGCPLCSLAADALESCEGKNDAVNPSSKLSRHEAVVHKRVLRFRNTQKDDPQIKDAIKDSAIYLGVQQAFLVRDSGLSPFTFSVQCGSLLKILHLGRFDAESAIPIPQTPNERLLGTGSARAFWAARKWLQNCKHASAHSACQEAHRLARGTEYSGPSRLLHVGDHKTEPYLVECYDTHVDYVALSYCWGTSDGNLKTTRGNIEKHRRSIPISYLPAMLRDAVLATRALGFYYVWIDALCIIQDDARDWSREASRMGTIYSNAQVTISSLVAEDATEGLFHPSKVRSPYPVHLAIWQRKRERLDFQNLDGKVQSYAVYRDWLHDDIVREGPVHARGWTLQEQLLSTRILYFGRGLLHWECLRHYVTEMDPAMEIITVSSARISRGRSEPRCIIKGFPIQDSIGPTPMGSLLPQTAFQVWQSQVEEITRRNFTKISDRLPAFQAISDAMVLNQDEFVGGIWKGDKLLESLCWKLESSSKQRLMPSWTWIIAQGQVSFHYVDTHGRGPDIIPKATVVSIDVKVDQISFEVSGSLRLKGRRYKKTALDRFTRESSLSVCFNCSFDYAPRPDRNNYFFDILEFQRSRPPRVVFLILQPVKGCQNKFRRVGIGSHEYSSLGFRQSAHELLESFLIKEADCEVDQVITIV